MFIYSILGCIFLLHRLSAQAQQCGGLLDGDNGTLAIKPSNSSCLWLIKLQNTTGIKLEMKNLTTDPLIVLPEQYNSESELQLIRITEPKNNYTFEGKVLAIVAPSQRRKASLRWTGMTVDDYVNSMPDDHVKSTTDDAVNSVTDDATGPITDDAVNSTDDSVTYSVKFKRDSVGRLRWHHKGNGTTKLFWAIEPEATGKFNWVLSADIEDCWLEEPCQCISFGVVHVMPNGSISSVLKTCKSSSRGSVKIEKNSKILVHLYLDSSVGYGSKFQVRWKPHQEVVTRNVVGILVGTETGLYTVYLKPFQITQIHSKSVRGMAFDWSSKKIYWAQYEVGIMRANLDGSDFEQIIVDEHALGVGIEPITGNLYYGSPPRSSLRVCDNDGQKCSTLARKVGYIYDIEFHPSKGFVFWSVTAGKIMRANLDGTNATEVVKRSSFGISVDETNNELYFVTGRPAKEISTCDLDGEEMRTLLKIPSLPKDVEIHADSVYYTSDEEKGLWSIADQDTNSTLIAEFTSPPRHIALFGKLTVPSMSNPCDKAECSHLCVLVRASSYRCLCPDGEQLQKDGFSCDIRKLKEEIENENETREEHNKSKEDKKKKR